MDREKAPSFLGYGESPPFHFFGTPAPLFLALRKNLEKCASVAGSENEELDLQLLPKDGILAKMAQTPELGRGNDAPWKPWKSPTRLFHRSHRAWKSRNGRGIPTFPQPRRRRVPFTPEDQTRQNRGFRQILA